MDSIEEIKERARRLHEQIQLDREHLDAQAKVHQENLRRIEACRAPVRIFGHTVMKPKVPTWVAVLVIVAFITLLVWAAIKGTAPG